VFSRRVAPFASRPSIGGNVRADAAVESRARVFVLFRDNACRRADSDNNNNNIINVVVVVEIFDCRLARVARECLRRVQDHDVVTAGGGGRPFNPRNRDDRPTTTTATATAEPTMSRKIKRWLLQLQILLALFALASFVFYQQVGFTGGNALAPGRRQQVGGVVPVRRPCRSCTVAVF